MLRLYLIFGYYDFFQEIIQINIESRQYIFLLIKFCELYSVLFNHEFINHTYDDTQ